MTGINKSAKNRVGIRHEKRHELATATSAPYLVAPKTYNLKKAAAAMFQRDWEQQNPGKAWTAEVAAKGKLFFTPDTLEPMTGAQVSAIAAAERAGPAALQMLADQYPALRTAVAAGLAALEQNGVADMFGQLPRVNYVVEAETKYEVPLEKMAAIETALASKDLAQLLPQALAADLVAQGFVLQKVGNAGKRKMRDKYFALVDVAGAPRAEFTSRLRLVGASQIDAVNMGSATDGRVDVKIPGAKRGKNSEIFDRLELTAKGLTRDQLRSMMDGGLSGPANPMAQAAKVTGLSEGRVSEMVTIADDRYEFFLGVMADGKFEQKYLLTLDSVTAISPDGTKQAKIGEFEFEACLPPTTPALKAEQERISAGLGEKFALAASTKPKATAGFEALKTSV